MTFHLRIDGTNLLISSPSGTKRVGVVVPFQGHFSFWVDPSCLQESGFFLPDAVIRYIQEHDIDRIFAYHKGHRLIYSLKSNNLLFTVPEFKVAGGILLPYSELMAEPGRADSAPHVPEKYSEVIE